jgi:hypothetical protein
MTLRNCAPDLPQQAIRKLIDIVSAEPILLFSSIKDIMGSISLQGIK